MLQHPNISPIALDLGFLQLHWYSLMYLLGLLCGYLMLLHFIKTGKTHIQKKQAEDAILFTAVGLLLGGRLGYFLFYQPSIFLSDPLRLLQLSDGGMSFHGAFLGILIAALLFSKIYKIALGEIVNILAITAPLGILFGRIGNFINQELWGRTSDLPWAMVFQKDPLGLARHPSQLYEALGEGLLVFLIILWFNRKQQPNWSSGALFVICYGSIRFFLEFFRQPDHFIGFDLFGWLTRGQLLCIPMVIVGLVVFYWAMRSDKAQTH